MGSQQEFKQTEIGRIPKEWEIKKLKEVVDINKQSRDPTREFPDKEFFYIDIDSIENGQGIIRSVKAMVGKEAPSRARRLIHYNDVIMSTVRPYLKAFAIIPREYDNQICSTGFAVLTCKEKILPLYLLYTLFSKPVIEQCNKMMVGGQYPALNSSQVEKIKLPLPPLLEQKKIAEILSTVDKAIEKVDEAINKTQKLKKGLMQELLTGRWNTVVPDPVGDRQGRREFKQTEIGRIPKEWEVVKLGDALELCQYGLSVQIKEQGKYPIIKMDDISNGYVVEDNIKYADLDEQTYKNFKLDRGDILFNRTNSYELVGRTGVFQLNGNYVFASYLIRLKPKHDIANSHFLTFYLIFKNDRIRQLATRAVHQANINATNLQNFKLPLPPVPEQKKIAEILSTVDKRLELLRKKREKLEKVKKGLMDDLLNGKKRVKTS